MRIFTYLFLLLLAAIGLSFAILNAQPVALNYYLGTITFPLSLLLIETLVLGAFLGLLASAVILIKVKNENRQLRRRIKNVEHELENLRALPLKDRP